MASSFSVRQFSARLARWQPRVYSVCVPKRTVQTSAATKTHNPAYPLYPSVIQLLHEKGISESEISKIPASGPKGRVLKGDVLAYLGAIAADYPSTQATKLQKLTHLDLSNIKIAPPPAPKPAEVPTAEKEEVPTPPPMASVAVSVSLAAALSVQRKLQENLGVSVPLATFLARASDLANDQLPRSSRVQPTPDELFNEILGGSPVTSSRGDYFPELNEAVAPQSVPSKKKNAGEDLIDILSSKPTKTPSASLPKSQSPPQGTAMNVFSLKVPMGDEKRARIFLERVKGLLQVEPGRLVL